MAGSVNKVLLVGRLGADPEVRTFQNGGKVGNLRVATSESWKDRSSGERRERTEWHHVVLRVEGAINYAADYCRKGDIVWIEGRMQTRKWQDRDGNDRYTTEVVVPPFGGEFTKLSTPGDSKGGTHGDSARGDASGGSNGNGAGAGGGPPPDDEGGAYDDLDDEVPF